MTRKDAKLRGEQIKITPLSCLFAGINHTTLLLLGSLFGIAAKPTVKKNPFGKTGAGKVITVDSADFNSHEPYQASEREKSVSGNVFCDAQGK